MQSEVKRWLVQIDEHNWLLYDDEDDIEEWDVILELTLPPQMALMLDFTQHAYHTMQSYFQAQWAIMQHKLDEAEGREPGPISGDTVAFDRLFETIVKENNLDKIVGEEEE